MTNSTVDGLGGDEVNQNVTITDTISGTNIYAATAVYSPTYSGATFNGTTFNGTTLASTTVTAGGRQLGAMGTGSPTTWGLGMQVGIVSGTNVPVVVTFGTAFKTAPVISTQLLISGAQATNAGYVAGPTSLGSFVFMGVSGAPYSWLAIGSL